MSKTTITICGGGSIGHVIAGILGACTNTNVRILSSRASLWENTITVEDCNGKIVKGDIERISSAAADVIPDSKIVFLCVPGYLIETILQEISPYLSAGTYVGACVASSGFFFVAEKILQDNFSLFGFQRVPYVARVKNYGKSVNLLGYKKELYLGCRYCNNTDFIVNFWQQCLATSIKLLPSFYDAALSNSNPILHPSRLFGMWHNWDKDTVYSRQLLFYEDWDDFSSEILVNCDNDFFNVIRHYPCTPGAIPRLLDYYESKTLADLSLKLRSIAAFKGIPAPMLKTDNGFIPDVTNRYFSEDIPFGLQIIKNLAVQASLKTPTIDKILEWYNDLTE